MTGNGEEVKKERKKERKKESLLLLDRWTVGSRGATGQITRTNERGNLSLVTKVNDLLNKLKITKQKKKAPLGNIPTSTLRFKEQLIRFIY